MPRAGGCLTPPAHTALIGVLALVQCMALAVYDGLQGSPREIIDLTTVCGVTAAGLIASTGRRRRERELADVRAVAEAAQRILLDGPDPEAALDRLRGDVTGTWATHCMTTRRCS